MALIWSAAAPPEGGPSRGAGAVVGRGEREGEVGVRHLSPCTRLARQSLESRMVDGGRECHVGLEMWADGWRWVGTLIREGKEGDRITANSFLRVSELTDFLLH